MTPRRVMAMAALLIGFAAPSLASAQSVAYAAPGITNMRAGPSGDYPVIARIAGGSIVRVYGCLRNYSWCDSSVQGIRGWIAASRLEFEYAGRLVPIQPYYTYFDAPSIVFDFGYWDRYYRDRPFYRDRDRWRRNRDRDRPRDRDRDRGTRTPEFGYTGGNPNFEEDDVRAGRRRNNPPDLAPIWQEDDVRAGRRNRQPADLAPCVPDAAGGPCP